MEIFKGQRKWLVFPLTLGLLLLLALVFTNFKVFAQTTAPWSIERDTVDASKLKFYQGNKAASILTLDQTLGRVGIGTTAPGSLLHLYNNTAGAWPSIMVQSGPSANATFISLFDGRTGGSNWQIENGRGGAGTGLGFYLGGSGTKMTLSTTGNLTVSGCVRYNSSTLGTCLSDIRLKKNINPLNVGLKQIIGLNPVTYQYNGLGDTIDDGSIKNGLIAQEVEKVAPELVNITSIKLHPNDATTTQMKTVDYGALNFALINAIKEQQKTIETLSATVEKQQAEIDSLKASFGNIGKP